MPRVFKLSRRTIALLSVLLSAPIFHGCAHKAAGPIEFLAGPVAPLAEPLTAIAAFPFLKSDFTGPTDIETEGDSGAFIARYAIVDGESQGATLIIERAKVSDASWRLSTFVEDSAAARTLVEEQVIALSDDDAAALLESSDHAEGVIVELRPRMLVLPATLSAAAPLEQEARMRLPTIENPESLREQGSAHKTLEAMESQTITASGKAFLCVRVREVFTSDLKLAKAVRTTNHWYAPGAGLVARRYEEIVKTLGITVKQRSQTILLLPP